MDYTAQAAGRNRLENLTVTRANGDVIPLGRPGTVGFLFRVWRYKRRLRREGHAV